MQAHMPTSQFQGGQAPPDESCIASMTLYCQHEKQPTHRSVCGAAEDSGGATCRVPAGRPAIPAGAQPAQAAWRRMTLSSVHALQSRNALQCCTKAEHGCTSRMQDALEGKGMSKVRPHVTIIHWACCASFASPHGNCCLPPGLGGDVMAALHTARGSTHGRLVV